MVGNGKMLPVFALIGALALLATPEAGAQDATNLNCKKCVGKGELAKNAVAFNRLNRALRKRIKDLERQVARLEALAELVPFISVIDLTQNIDGVPTSLPTIRLEAVNLQLVNGTGQTLPNDAVGPNGPNGLGNLIIGYDEARSAGGNSCSDGSFDNQFDCETNGGIWALVHKSGSHSLVVGPRQNYSQGGGAVFGSGNTVSGTSSSVTGGLQNTASGSVSSVTGGAQNAASGGFSSVSGGFGNMAGASNSSVSGGFGNMAEANNSSVSGGFGNTASGDTSTVVGGNGATVSTACDWGGEEMDFGDGAC